MTSVLMALIAMIGLMAGAGAAASGSFAADASSEGL
tara:strand:- start:568 stop:675 length:108 start_codon:yes stop_codon:yes gene_type:complete